ncbi:hypothetical protein HB780_10870 (plasmid) [Rhizobium lusitanum]|uniref:hypothetical protein n=1 Tax=Rhizobium lusitanum TaxID=293958 RepID=UPI001616A3B3|nr:hypothetical protein [Rhizobium lusitanum]QND46772.1 hypothetical protein HB780_10870 [Rhizobium lusitanum]
MKRVVGMLIAFAMSASVVEAASCESNFKTTGVPMVTAVSYKTWQELPKAKAATVLKTLAQAVAAEGFSGIKIDRELSAIDAYQETTGSGRIQTLRVVARKKGAGVRVDAIFDIQAGQVTSNNAVRTGLCNIVNSASG